MAKKQTRTEFFESIIVDKNMPSGQVVLFFSQAYNENAENPDEQLRLLDLLQLHRPEFEEEVARDIIQGI